MAKSNPFKADDLRDLMLLLAVGGQTQLVTYDDWMLYLWDLSDAWQTETGRNFAERLRKEWRTLYIPTPYCLTITREMYAFMQTRRGPWAAWWGHILRVAGTSVWLARKIGISEEEAYLAAIFHDIHKLDEKRRGIPHPRLGAMRAKARLKDEMDKKAVKRIARAIDVHPSRPPDKWPLACVLHDADKLDKIGATGLLRRIHELRTPDSEKVCRSAWRSLRDMRNLPDLCFYDEAKKLYRRKRRVAEWINAVYDDICE